MLVVIISMSATVSICSIGVGGATMASDAAHGGVAAGIVACAGNEDGEKQHRGESHGMLSKAITCATTDCHCTTTVKTRQGQITKSTTVRLT